MFFRQNVLSVFVVFMVRLKCKKCGNVFEQDITAGMVLGPHLGPYKRITCPACGKGGWYNIYSSVKEPVTWPPEEKKAEQPEQQLTEEELEKKRIEESKYEST
jgi:RNase P subunit RPR2